MPIPLPELPEDNTGICLVIPNSPEWRQIYLGALVLLQQWWYYQVSVPVDAEDVIQRVQECAYLTGIDGYSNCMDLCALIIECINDPESGVANAITNLINGSTSELARANGQSWNNTDMSSGSNPECDYDILFGQAMQLVDYLDTVNVDFFEQLEVATNIYDFVANVVGDITGIDELSIDAMLSWVTFVQENIAENYNAQVTTGYKETLACEIFCQAKENNCAITPTILFDILKARLDAVVTIESLIEESLEFLFTGSWSGTEIADFMFFAQFSFRSMLGRFIGAVAWNDIDTRLAIYSNDPNSDWSILCDCPDLPDYVFDFTIDQQGWNIVDQTGQPASGVYESGQGIEQNYAAGRWRVQAWYDVGETVTVAKMEIDFNWMNAGVTHAIQWFESATIEGVSNVLETNNPSTSGNPITVVFEDEHTVDQFVVNSANGTLNSFATKGNQKLVAVRVWLA